MKDLKIGWKLRIGSQNKDRFPVTHCVPALPSEIWRKILSFTVRISGGTGIEIDDPFLSPGSQNEEDAHIDPGIYTDRKNLSRVCSSWRSVVVEVSAEYLIITNTETLKALVKLFEASQSAKGRTGNHLGEWTRRIDFKILGPYKPTYVVRLLKCMPHLLIYHNGNDALPSHAPVQNRYTPPEVLEALIKYCSPSLQRVEWSRAYEAPRYKDLVRLCNALPNLLTLRLVAVHSFPVPNEQDKSSFICLPKLRTLSLGIIPYDSTSNLHNPEFALTWDPFLQHVSFASGQLPSLKNFDCELFPLQPMPFLQAHGQKIRRFRTTAWSIGSNLVDVGKFFPNLQHLVIARCSEVVNFPASHPTLEKVCITPTSKVETEVPPRVFAVAVIDSLDCILESIEKMDAPRLEEVRIRDEGVYRNIGVYSTWLSQWSRRFRTRGVNFFNKKGCCYGITSTRAT